jgi:hypothetical protein
LRSCWLAGILVEKIIEQKRRCKRKTKSGCLKERNRVVEMSWSELISTARTPMTLEIELALLMVAYIVALRPSFCTY